MMASAVHLMVNEVHPSEASDVHDCLWRLTCVLLMTPCEAPDLHDRICRPIDGKCSTSKRGS